MTDPSDLYLCTMIYFLHYPNFCLVLSIILIFTFFMFPFFTLSHHSRLVTPCSAFEHFCSFDFKLYDEIMPLLTGILLLNLSATPISSLFLLHLLYFLLPCLSKISIPALLYIYLLAILPTISFLAAFAIISSFPSDSFLEFCVWPAIFGIWCINI